MSIEHGNLFIGERYSRSPRTRCHYCEFSFRDEDMSENGVGDPACDNCLDEHEPRCDFCRERSKDGILLNDKWKCRECVENEDE